MRVVFMGTPEFAAVTLREIYKKHEIAAVFTQPDKVNMRGNKVKYSPVKEFALENEIKLYQPKSVKESAVINELKEINPDIIVVVAYGRILPNELIEIPKYGTINVHASLLPKYRGAAPIHAAIINGEKETGVTIMHIAEELDAGDMILKKATPINEEDNLETVHDRLAILGAEACLEAMEALESGSAQREVQNYSEATFVKPIKKEECIIEWSKSSREIYNKIRGMNPFPTAFTTLNGKIVKIYSAVIGKSEFSGSCGEAVAVDKENGIVIKTGDGTVILTKVKPENKNVINGRDFVNGNYIKIGDKFN